ncbi:PDC sensor domain-containing protein [Peribacillus sp. NPDC097264]|uniref:PDC sensor domain-containing protein n=1 Tax=Peribacillus sp. NPDC097264 TaxID=3390616 RepID=UPI003D01E994
MNSRQRFSKYILIVILPLIILTITYWLYFDYSIQEERKAKAEWIGSVYQKSIDQVIRETKGNVEWLSRNRSIPYMDEKSKNQLLDSIKDTDPRYADIYLLDREGMTIHSTSKQPPNPN